MSRTRLTLAVVSRAQPATARRVVWDGALPGFGLRISGLGVEPPVKTYVLFYRCRGAKRMLTLGRHGAPQPPDGRPLTPDLARLEARRLLGLVAAGQDPASQRAAARDELTLRHFIEREYLPRYAEPRKKASTLVEDRRKLDSKILPALGGRRLTAITRADVARFHASLADTPVEANRCLALLKAIYAVAEDWEFIAAGVSPCQGIEKFRERARERFLSLDEIRQLGCALVPSLQDPATTSPAHAIAFLLLTGMRKSEVVNLRVSEIDFDNNLLRLADSKTGPKSVPLGEGARAWLQRWLAHERREASPYVFPGRRLGRPLTGLQSSWERIRNAAELPDVRLHDLRHTFASVGAANSISLQILGRALGHAEIDTTQRYAHLAPGPVRAAVDGISAQIGTALALPPPTAPTQEA